MKQILLSKILTTLAAVSAAVLLSGCFETKDEFTLNPDGSGKVVHESKFQNMNLSGDNEATEESLKEAIAKVIEGTKGVGAWRDVSYKRLDDGRLYFKGTAYFKNLSQLDIPNQTQLEFDWKTGMGGNGVLTLRTNKGGGHEGFKVEKKSVDLTKLSPDERAKKIKEERAKFQQMKPMMAGFMGTMKHEVILHLPGQPVSQSNFTKDASGALHLVFDGAKLLDAMDKLINDDAWVAKNLGSFSPGADKPAMDEEVNAAMFGSKAPVQAAVTGATKPAFDYAVEAAAAKKEFAKIQKQLGTSPVTVAPPAKGGTLKSLKVVGVRLVTESDKKRELRPFNYDAGYAVVLLAELPGSVLAITDKSGLDTAVADDGSVLLKDSEWDRRFSFPKLSTDKAAVLLEAELKAPGPGVKGLKELSGHLQYNVAGSAKEIDLGFTDLTAKAKGMELGAQIESIEDGWQKNGSQQMHLKLKTDKDALKAVYLIVGDEKTELKQNGYSGGMGSFTFTYELKTAFPAKGRLVAEVYDQLQTFDVPFKLENISLLGASLNGK